MTEARKVLDGHMYGGRDGIPSEDKQKCREVYNAVCKVLDLL